MKLLLTVKEASEFLQMSELHIRLFIRNDPNQTLGTAIKGTGNKYIYHIPLKKAEAFIGRSYDEFLKTKEK